MEFTQEPAFGDSVDINNLYMRCTNCTVTARIQNASKKECQWWINLFRMKHEKRECPRRM